MQPEGIVSRIGLKIVFCWLATSVPVAYFIWPFVEPTYEASSILRVDPFPPQTLRAAPRGRPRSQDRRSLPPDPG